MLGLDLAANLGEPSGEPNPKYLKYIEKLYQLAVPRGVHMPRRVNGLRWRTSPNPFHTIKDLAGKAANLTAPHGEEG